MSDWETRAGRKKPTAMERQIAARIRVKADKRLGRATPAWIADLAAFEAELESNHERIRARRAINVEQTRRRYAYIRRQVTEDLKRQQAEQRRRQKAVIRARLTIWWLNHPLVKAWRER